MNKPSAMADQPFRAMKVNSSKERSFYTQRQRFAARVLFTAWLLVIGSPDSTLATSPQGRAPHQSPSDACRAVSNALHPTTVLSPHVPTIYNAHKTVMDCQRALAIREQFYHETPNHPDIARALSHLGTAWGTFGDARKAIIYFNRALAIFEQRYNENRLYIASTLMGLGTAWGTLRHATKAISLYECALGIYEQCYQETPHPSIATTLNNLGTAWGVFGDPRKAIYCFNRALVIYKQIYQAMPYPQAIASTLNNLGTAWGTLGDATKAVHFYQYALVILQQVYQMPHPDIALVLNNLRIARDALGEVRQEAPRLLLVQAGTPPFYKRGFRPSAAGNEQTVGSFGAGPPAR